MKDRRTALILLATAIMFAVGAYLLFIQFTDSDPVHRAQVGGTVEAPPTAPEWIKGKNEVKPDYSPSDAPPKARQPVVVEEKEQEEPTAVEKPVLEVVEDTTVTYTFVESLTDFLLQRFSPTNIKGRPETLATAMELNRYYGRELEGFTVAKDDIQAARKAIFAYALSPSMIDTLYSLYADPFLLHLVDTAANEEREYVENGAKVRRTLNTVEIQTMLRLNARRIEKTAALFRAMGNTQDITDMAARYRRSARAVERANEQLQDAIASGSDTAKAGERLKTAILQREHHKTEIVSTLKRICPSCTEGELFYLAQWGYRRVVNGPENAEDTLKSFTKISSVLADLATRFLDKAGQLN